MEFFTIMHKSMLRNFIPFSIAVVLSFFCGCVTNPVTGQQELMLLPVQQDIEIGRRYAPEVEKQMGGTIVNQSLQDYVDSVGQKIARISHNRDFDYHFTALNDKSVNALALPGGYVFVTKGMLEQLTTEAQLASVLAHEVVHIVARDTSNMISNQIGIDILLSVAASQKTPRGLLTAADLTRQILSLQYSRGDERIADLAGLNYMVLAGYDPQGMVETLQVLQRQNDLAPIEFLSTHPSPENRVEYIKEKIQTRYYGIEGLKSGQQDYNAGVLQHLR